jgi:hypothetical protein
MTLYSNHFAKNKCPNLIFVDTQSKYMIKTKEQMEKGEGKMRAKGKRKAKTKAIGKTDKAEKQDMGANLDDTDMTYENDDLNIHLKEKGKKNQEKGNHCVTSTSEKKVDEATSDNKVAAPKNTR